MVDGEFEAKPGFYWVRVSEIVCDGGGIIDDPLGAPQVGRWDGLDWFLTGVAGPLADQFTVVVISPGGLEPPRVDP